MPVLLPPTFVPAVTLPTGAAVRKVITLGQSNALGESPTYIQNQTVPCYIRALDEKFGRAGVWERLGSVTRDQAVPPSLITLSSTLAKKRGALTQAALDLVTGGKSPVMASICRAGTAISYWGPGQPGETAFNLYAGEIVASAGATNWHVIIIWGESDANGAGTAAAWQANLTAFVAVVRAKFTSARIYVVNLNINYDDGAAGVNRTTVRAGNVAFVAGDGNAELLNWDAFGYATPHYTDAGYISGGSNISARVLVNQP